MAWMELLEEEVTNDCKKLILAKEKKIHGMILFFAQDNFSMFLDYEIKEKLSLHQTDTWLEGDQFYLEDDYYAYISCRNDDFDSDEVNEVGFLLLSIIMSKVVINLKNDPDLRDSFSDDLKIGMDLDETNQKPTFHGNYFGGYEPSAELVKDVIETNVSDEDNKALILDLIKEVPTGVGLDLWKELHGQYSTAPSEQKLISWFNDSLKWYKKGKFKKIIKNIEPGIQVMADDNDNSSREVQASCCNQVGVAHLELDNIDSAFFWFKRSYELADYGYGGVNLCRVYIDHKKDFEKGLELANILKEHMNKFILHGYAYKYYNLINLLKANLALGNEEEARAMAKELSDYIKENSDGDGMANTIQFLFTYQQEGYMSQELMTEFMPLFC